MSTRSISLIQTRRRGSATYVLTQKPFLQSALVLYCLLVVAVECAISTLQSSSAREISAFLVATVGLLTAAAGGLAVLRKYSKYILLGCSVFLALLPPTMLTIRDEHLALLDLYFLALIATPILFRIWGWQEQLLVSLVSIASMTLMSIQSSSGRSFISLFLVTVSAVLATFVAVIRPVEHDLGDLNLIEQRHFERIKTGHFEKHVWKSLLLQGMFILILIFVDISVNSRVDIGQVVPKIYALIVIVLNMLVLRIVKREQQSIAVLASTVLVAICLASGRGLEPSLVSSAVPLIYLAFSTAGLPWFSGKQLVLAWALSLIVIFSRVFAELQWSVEAFAHILGRYQVEIQLTIIGAAVSVAVARVLEQRSVKNLSSLREEGTFDLSLKETLGHGEPFVLSKERFVSKAENDIADLRARHLLRGLTVYGVLHCFLATILLMSMRTSYWSIAGIGWLVFFILWGVVGYLAFHEQTRERAWLAGGLLTLLLFFYPASLLVLADSGRDYWIVLPVSVLIGFGSTPWVLAEVLPLVGAGFVAGVEILSRLGVGYRPMMLFAIACTLSIIFATQLYRRLKEIYLLTNFHDSIHRTTNLNQAALTLADYLKLLFDAEHLLISAASSSLTLIRGHTLYGLKSEAWPIDEVRQGSRNFILSESGVGLSTVNWLPAHYGFFDFSFGEFSPRHGVMLELRPPADLTDLAERPDIITEGVREKWRLLIFIPSRLPLFSFFRKEALVLATTLCSITTLHLRTFREIERRGQERSLAEQSRAEREYELSTLVHDINNTVQDLTLLCDGILEDVEGAENVHSDKSANVLVERVARIATMARSMATVVSDAKRKRELERLVDLSPREHVEVMGVVEEIVEFARIRGERRRIIIQSAGIDRSASLWVRVSAREHLETILRNLLNNAVMYTDPGTVVTIAVRYSDEWVWIDCRDTGPGLSSEECQLIFLSGVRGRAGKKRSGGLGVGLSQSRRVAESAGGTLEVQSPGAGQGATFTVALPRQQAPDTRHLGRESWALIVEDQPSLSEFYAKIMKALHITPALAASTIEAEGIVATRGRPSFVLTDLHLGGSDGLDLVKSLRKRFDAKLPILVVSGLSDENIEERVRHAGATDFLAKPVGKRILFARIQSLLPAG